MPMIRVDDGWRGYQPRIDRAVLDEWWRQQELQSASPARYAVPAPDFSTYTQPIDRRPRMEMVVVDDMWRRQAQPELPTRMAPGRVEEVLVDPRQLRAWRTP